MYELVEHVEDNHASPVDTRPSQEVTRVSDSIPSQNHTFKSDQTRSAKRIVSMFEMYENVQTPKEVERPRDSRCGTFEAFKCPHKGCSFRNQPTAYMNAVELCYHLNRRHAQPENRHR